MVNSENIEIMHNLRDALVGAARVVNDNFGKDPRELGAEYKLKDGDTARTVIDRYAEERMKDFLFPKYPGAVFNLEETDVEDADLEGKLLIFGDPFDGTANAQPRLPLSTQGLIAAQGREYTAAAALPFERYVVFGAKGEGVFRRELVVDNGGEFHITDDSKKILPHLSNTYERLKSGELVLMPYVDAHYTPINFVNERKTKWKALFVETFDKAYGGKFRNARMMRELGSNIDATGLKLPEGRMHVSLTDTVGGIYDVAAGAVFLPMLGGMITDKDGNNLRVPKNSAEMKTPLQQIVICSIHPELHEPLVEITKQCYGADSEVYFPMRNKLIRVPEYTGFKDWDADNKVVFDDVMGI